MRRGETRISCLLWASSEWGRQELVTPQECGELLLTLGFAGEWPDCIIYNLPNFLNATSSPLTLPSLMLRRLAPHIYMHSCRPHRHSILLGI